MRYINRAYMSAYYPKLLGTYEMEVSYVIERIIAAKPKRLINIGSAEGYFAVGMAIALPDCEIVTFESSNEASNMLRELACKNNVEARIKTLGESDHPSLNAVLKNTDRATLVVDIEGGEDELLNPHMVQDLQTATMIVEVHEEEHENLKLNLMSRFIETHNITEIVARDRTFKDLPFRFPSSFQGTFIGRCVKLMMDEQRVDGKLWLYFEPR